MTTRTLCLTYLDDDRRECSEEISVEDAMIHDLAVQGREIVAAYGEYTAEEVSEMEDIDLARLALSSNRGGDAYSLACASYLA